MQILYKILSVNINNEAKTGIDMIIANLIDDKIYKTLMNRYFENNNIEDSEELSNINEKDLLKILYDNGDSFIFALKSKYANHLKSFPHINIELESEDFCKGTLNLYGSTQTDVFTEYHYNRIKGYSFDIEFSFNEEIGEIIENCMFRHHTDMFFGEIIRIIFKVEFEDKQIPINKDSIIDLYKKVLSLSSFVLFEVYKIKIDAYDELSNHDKNDIMQKYKNLVNNSEGYIAVISTYIIERENIKKTIIKELNDIENSYDNFISTCMLKGFLKANNRFLQNWGNESYFDFEICKTQENEVIKVFLTPYGIINQRVLNEIYDNDKLKFKEFIDQYLSQHGILPVIDEELKEKLSTSFIYKTKKDKIFFYKRRPNDWEYASFGEQNRRSPFLALLERTQFNLTLVNPSDISKSELRSPLGFEMPPSFPF